VRILIVGGGGMLGQKLVTELAKTGKLIEKKIDQIILADAFIEPRIPSGASFEIIAQVADITSNGVAESLIGSKVDVIFHLAAIVSGEAEADFEKGYRVNVDGTRNLFEAIRKIDDGYCPRVVFTSSVAVYGGPYPDIVGDDFHLQPRTSYGTQKAIGELLLNDYSRRGFLDGIGLRLPTICVRPGLPNRAASGLFSNIIREPLVGLEAILPAGREIRNIFASPRSAVGFLINAATLDTSLLGDRRCLMMPGVTSSLGDEIDALGRVAGAKIVSLIKEERDPIVEKMVANWNPPPFTSARTKALGFTCEDDFDEIIRVHIQDELGGKIPGLEK
jgi:nucleoside-diphosphate-sugar epimerase